MQMNRFVLLFLIEFVRLALCEVEENSDAVLDLIRSSGYKGKRYQVETEDGYLLMVHRMSSKTNLPAKHPVLLLHGLFATSADYVLTGPKSALAYLLADNGYDVWLGNARGNNYSANHKTLSPESGDFWNFSWHEIGFYDLPATVDFILNETKSSKVFYVGHSQGSTSFLVFLSTHPEYNDKLAQAHLLAPAAFMKNEKFPKLLRVLGDEVANGLLSDYKFLNLAAYWDLGEKLSEYFCIEQHTKLCEKTYFVVFGANQNGIKVDNVNCKNLTFTQSNYFNFSEPYVQYFATFHHESALCKLSISISSFEVENSNGSIIKKII